MKSLVCNPEATRLEAIRQSQILDTAPEQAFDDLALLTAQIFDAPIAVINLIDAQRQWFKAKLGWDIQEMGIDIGFCQLCLHNNFEDLCWKDLNPKLPIIAVSGLATSE